MTVSQLVDGEWKTLTDEEHTAQILAEAAEHGIDLCPRCFYGNRVDGVCEICARTDVLYADPDYREWSDAQARLDFGGWAPDSTRPYTFDDGRADEALVKRLSAKFNAAERNASMDPGGCAKCGLPERGHPRWHGPRWQGHGAPSRGFEAPSDALRKARMVARRNMRAGRPAWAALTLDGAA